MKWQNHRIVKSDVLILICSERELPDGQKSLR